MLPEQLLSEDMIVVYGARINIGFR